jgi:hypothetical protein
VVYVGLIPFVIMPEPIATDLRTPEEKFVSFTEQGIEIVFKSSGFVMPEIVISNLFIGRPFGIRILRKVG